MMNQPFKLYGSYSYEMKSKLLNHRLKLFVYRNEKIYRQKSKSMGYQFWAFVYYTWRKDNFLIEERYIQLRRTYERTDHERDCSFGEKIY